MYHLPHKVLYISDGANWVIKEIGESLKRNIDELNFQTVTSSRFSINCIRHYSTRYDIKKILFNIPTVKNVITYFHGDNSDKYLLRLLKKRQKKINVIHTSCDITKNHLIHNGIDPRKIIIIPIGIDVNNFMPVTTEQKMYLRKQYNIPANSLIIGSFQKDGNGWDEGLEPKLCKGPDIFCEIIKKINKSKKVFVLLTGPSRGYVKSQLIKSGIPYKHIFLDDYKKIKQCYQMLDLYLVTSRLEGGPRAPMECQASGIPIISTNVGQVSRVIEHGHNGFIFNINNINNACELAHKILDSSSIKNKLIKNGLKSVGKFDYSIIAKQYVNKIYLPLLNK